MGIILDIKKITQNIPNYKIIKTNLIVNPEGDNKIRKHLEDFQNKWGIYIFSSKKHDTVYIGSAGSSNKFVGRISRQLNPGDSSSIIPNIAFYHSLCGEYQHNKYIITDKKCAKKSIIKYAPILTLIDLSDFRDEKIIEIEQKLIFKHRPIYNWTLNINKKFQTS